MKINKRGAAGESAIMIYRVMFVTIIAFVVMGTSSVIYDYSVKAEDTESMLLGRVVIDCVTEDGAINLDNFELTKEEFFEDCGVNVPEDQFFVALKFYRNDEKFDALYLGDDGLEWVNKIYNSKLKVESIKEYEPGYFNTRFPVLFVNTQEKFEGEILLEVIVKHGE